MTPSLPATMTAIEIRTPGQPEVLQATSRPVARPGAGEILIRVAAAGVNRPDVVQRSGNYPPPPGASDIPGLEVAGSVAALGPGVSTVALGERVCALVTGGGYAGFCVAQAAHTLPVPRGLTMVEAAGLPETVFTVWHNVFERGRLATGETFLVHGGSSGIGTAAIQLAKAMGARVFATAGSDDKCAACTGLGADLAINYRRQDFVAEVLGATGKKGVDVILDMVGGPYLSKNIQILAPDGRLVQIAFLQGSKAEVNFMPVMLKRLTITGSTLRPQSNAAKARIAQGIRDRVWPLVEAGRIKPVIFATFPMGEAAAAHRLMESSQHIGKIVLVCDEQIR
ncbi:MAG: NAD(P)H-quinone oxidoreductase [Alphaproteobacteria bacterium]